MPDTNNIRTCICEIQQFGPIVFNTVAYQNSANTVYNSKAGTLAASTDGTLPNGSGAPIFKSDYERMQFLLGKVGGCGVRPIKIALGTN